MPFDDAGEVVDAFAALGLIPDLAPSHWSPAAGVRLRQRKGVTHLDLFFSLDERYEEIARRKRWFPFGAEGRELPFLSAEDLAVFKLSFGRDKDWVDLRRLLAGVRAVDLGYIERQLIGLRGPTMYPRVARLRAMARQAGDQSVLT